MLAGALTLCAANLAGRGIFSPAPYGNVFLLARLIADGPGVAALQRHCPETHWRLCPWRDAMPASADAFLWRADSPMNRAGGPKAVSAEADAIIAATVRDQPAAVLADAARNTLRQLGRFASGDGLRPWPATVTPWLVADFPKFEQRAYEAARQTRGLALLPGWMGWLHWSAELAAALGCVVLLPWLWRRDRALGGAVLACLFALGVNAAVTGALSGPHDRYQSRVMWLPLALVLLAP